MGAAKAGVRGAKFSRRISVAEARGGQNTRKTVSLPRVIVGGRETREEFALLKNIGRP